MPVIDLHVHSTASDGTMSPAEVVHHAQSLGLSAIGLTDHDSLSGIPEALETGESIGIEVIPGCELSVESPQGAMHILGYWVRPDGSLDHMLTMLRKKRHERNRAMIGKLQKMGMDLEYEEVRALSGGGSVGRPHLARVLVEKGYVRSVDEAFRSLLGSQGAAYVPKEKPTPGEAIEALRQEGALAFLAHPFSLELAIPDLDRIVQFLKELGLQGIEAWYSGHDDGQVRYCLEAARRYDLLVSGGSDFHGSVKPKIHLGTGLGNLHVPLAALEGMKKYRQDRKLWI